MAQKVIQLVQIGEYSSTKHEFLFSENLNHFSHLESDNVELAKTYSSYGPTMALIWSQKFNIEYSSIWYALLSSKKF